MLRYDRVSLYTEASNLFLFLESPFLFLAHRTLRSLIIYLGEREDDESARKSGLDLEACEREEIGELMRESESGADIGENASRDG